MTWRKTEKNLWYFGRLISVALRTNIVAQTCKIFKQLEAWDKISDFTFLSQY